MVGAGTVVERKKKLIQFLLMFHVLSTGSAMLTYESSQALFVALRVPDVPTRHWSDSAGWEIAEAMSHIVKEKTVETIRAAHFISITADEVTSVDNANWLSTHVYVVLNFKRTPILLSLVKVTDGCTAENLTKLIVEDLKVYGGLTDQEMVEKLVCFGADGASVFQGVKSGVTKRIRQKVAPYLIGVHCVAHRTSLAVQTMSNLPIVQKIETLCQSMYAFLCKSPKRFAAFQKLAEDLDTEGRKIIRHVKQRWISLIMPLKSVLRDYKTLLVQMQQNSEEVGHAEKNYQLLCDVTTLLAFPCVLPLLEILNQLIKYAQGRDVYMCDYVRAIKIAQLDLREAFIDPVKSFQRPTFQQFADLVDNSSATMTLEWISDVNGVQHLSYCIGSQLYPAHIIDAVTFARLPVSQEGFLNCVHQVKEQCCAAAELVIAELDANFPSNDIMDALSIVFLQFWMEDDTDVMFDVHLATLKQHYGTIKSVAVGSGRSVVPGAQVTAPVNLELLDMQQYTFKMVMREHSAKALEEPITVNPMTKLWQSVHRSGLMKTRLSEYFKLVEIAVVTIIGSVEDERTFSTLAFMKSRVRNRLVSHLDCTIRMFAHKFFTVQSFPYEAAIT